MQAMAVHVLFNLGDGMQLGAGFVAYFFHDQVSFNL